MITLEPFERDDAERLCSWFTSPEDLLQWGGPGFQFPLTPAQVETHLLSIASGNGTHFAYKVRDVQTGSVIGHGELTRVDSVHRSARISRVLVGPASSRGKGYGTQIVHGLMTLAFDQMHLHRLELEVYDFNAPAIRCYEKLGFVREGLRRDAVLCGLRYWNSVLMSCLEHERKRA